MKRYALITKIKPGMMDYYQSLHDNIWEEVVKVAHEANIRNYSIHRIGQYLFSYFEYIGEDYKKEMEYKNSKEIVKMWRTETGKCFEPFENGETQLFLEEIFFNPF